MSGSDSIRSRVEFGNTNPNDTQENCCFQKNTSQIIELNVSTSAPTNLIAASVVFANRKGIIAENKGPGLVYVSTNSGMNVGEGFTFYPKQKLKINCGLNQYFCLSNMTNTKVLIQEWN